MQNLTTTQIVSAIRRKILEESTDLVTDEVVLLNANEAYKDLKYSTYTNDQIKTATVDLISGVGTLPTDFGTLYGPGYKNSTDRTPYNETNIADFDRYPDVEAMTIENDTLKVNPSSTASIIIKYYPEYAPLALSPVQNPEIHELLHELIIYGAIYRIYEDLQNEALSEFFKIKYDEELTKKTSKISNYEEDNQNGGQMFNGIRII